MIIDITGETERIIHVDLEGGEILEHHVPFDAGSNQMNIDMIEMNI